MKNWTCCLLSFALIFTSMFSEWTVLKKATSAFLEIFMGLEAEKSEKEIVIDFSEDNIPEDMRIEIENIKAQIVLEETTKTDISRPPILIYHTHTNEAFFKGDQDYVETSSGRTKNQEYNVVAVGDTLKTALEGYGFSVIHDKTDNEAKGFNQAYQTSYATIEPYIGKVNVFIDLHRDAYMGQQPNCLETENGDYAYICFVVARGENYTYKPNWQENYKLAQKLTDKLNELCPGVCKDIIFKNTRFNQHVSDSCLLIEVGNEKNSLEEVKASAKLTAQAFNIVF